ncbi:MAG: M81 family metallopeptidase [Candidatus Cloacimonetes bacterium]|jgi:microcystin degradation protein MlrC|nr:M81 family metallopeptidase [Candidatus Cloacimonadota bacterium]
MKTVAIGGFFHESNTFNPIITGIDDFNIFEADEFGDKKESYLLAKGMVDFFEEHSDYYKILPLIFARAVPNGEIDRKLYQSLKDRFFELLSQGGVPDVFVLPLHGSMRIEGIGSAESDLLADIKARYPEVPIILGLDMHATITESMLAHTEGMVGFKTAPHIDAWETGYQAAQMADQLIKEKVKLSVGFEKLPYLIAGEKSETDCSPMREIIARLREMETEDDVLAASLLLGFPWADTAENGVTALVVTKDNQAKADAYAREIAGEFEARKESFGFSSPAYEAEKALELALGEDVKPVFVSDSGDNPTAGSTGDNTTVIRLLSTDLKDRCKGKKILVAGIYDPIALKKLRDNMYREVELSVGGVYDTEYCSPCLLKGKAVRHVENFGVFASEIILFETESFELIITSKHIGFTGVAMFEALGLDYMNMDVIVVKLGYLTPDFKEIAAKSYLALSRGCTDEVLSRLNYRHTYKLI